jgi:uncharacterized protein (TIGR03435 family)
VRQSRRRISLNRNELADKIAETVAGDGGDVKEMDRMKRIAAGIGAAVLASCGLFGQTAPPPRAFEVASIRPHPGRVPRIGVYTSGPLLTAEACAVKGLIMYAYNVENYQVASTAPLSTVGDIRYDVVAKAEGAGVPTTAEFREMLQSLLADRFKLAVHREMRGTPVYALVVGRNGPKLKKSASEAGPMANVGVSGRDYEVNLPKATMDRLVELINQVSGLDRPVVDKTAIAGAYDIRLTFTPEYRISRGEESDLSGIRIFTAVEQLGLRLAPQKADVETIVVDRVEKPSEN